MKTYLLNAILLLISNNILNAQENVNFSTDLKKDKVVLPLTYRNGVIPVVEVMINGKGPYRFQFDTGAAGEARLDSRLFDDLSLKSTDSIRVGDGSGRNARWLPVVKIESITLGDFVITNTRAMIRNYNTNPSADKIDGVIGLGFFSGILVEINFEKNQLILSKEKINLKSENAIPFNFDRGVPVLTADINGKLYDFTFDTGNMGNLTFNSSVITTEIIKGDIRVVGRAQTVSNTFEIKEALLAPPIKIGKLVFEDVVININDVIPGANIGAKFSKQLNIKFDVANRLMEMAKFVKPAAVAFSSNNLKEYTGEYEGGRVVTLKEDGFIYIQRPGGMQLKMMSKGKDEFILEAVTEAAFRFVRDGNGNITAMKVSRDNGKTWETSLKSH